ncbi:MAG: hypothetical protein AB1458_07900 [Bacteroidota bacterium]
MNRFFKKTFVPGIFITLFSLGASAQDNTGVFNADGNSMVREDNASASDSVSKAGNNLNILEPYNSEEILVVVQDIFGNESYSKIVFRNQCAVLKAYDPYNVIPSGVYTVVATSRNEIYNQKIVID